MKLKVGDTVIEDDGIITLVYKIVRVENGIATGVSKFEGKTYYTMYRARYLSRKHIKRAKPFRGDLTRIYLAK